MGKLLTLDRALERILTALLTLLGAPAAPRELSPRVPALLGQQDVLQPDAAGRPACRKRRRAVGRAPRRGSRADAAQAAPRQARESVLPGGDRLDPGGDEGADGGARSIPADATGPGNPGSGYGPDDAGRSHRPARP